MTQQPIDYASGSHTQKRFGGLGAACLFLSVTGIVLGLGLFGLGALLGFGARVGGGPGILVAIAGLILGATLNLVAFVMGIVALRRGPSKTKAVIGTALSGVIVVPLLALALILAFKLVWSHLVASG
jgi:hypothetical protein